MLRYKDVTFGDVARINMLMDQVDIFVLSFLVNVFISLYLLNRLMDQVDTLHVQQSWKYTKLVDIGLKFYVVPS